MDIRATDIGRQAGRLSKKSSHYLEARLKEPLLGHELGRGLSALHRGVAKVQQLQGEQRKEGRKEGGVRRQEGRTKEQPKSKSSNVKIRRPRTDSRERTEYSFFGAGNKQRNNTHRVEYVVGEPDGVALLGQEHLLHRVDALLVRERRQVRPEVPVLPHVVLVVHSFIHFRNSIHTFHRGGKRSKNHLVRLFVSQLMRTARTCNSRLAS